MSIEKGVYGSSYPKSFAIALMSFISNNKFVIGLAGTPRAGKSVVVSVAKGSDHGVTAIGNIVREEAERRCLKLHKSVVVFRRRKQFEIFKPTHAL